MIDVQSTNHFKPSVWRMAKFAILQEKLTSTRTLVLSRRKCEMKSTNMIINMMSPSNGAVDDVVTFYVCQSAGKLTVQSRGAATQPIAIFASRLRGDVMM